jgi:DNA-binding CsgD family transcriptional regulator
LSALRDVTAGGSVIDPKVVEVLVTRRARLRESPLAGLTARELDVLREMAQGRGNAGIAGRLALSESSVEKHVNAIFAKLGLSGEQAIHRRVAAVLTFLRDAGLRPPSEPVLPGGGPEIAVVDIWRVDDGLITEGCEIIEPVAQVAANLVWWEPAAVTR